ncbi:MAG: amino acid permease [Candidatus Aminicenantes bacterium]
MTPKTKFRGHGFGTSPIFLAAISTILGAILFLRFGYAVAHASPFGALLIILIGHAITIPTALAIAEIATNLKVEGGGEYFIISRSFGNMIGGTIGIFLYFSQAISVAFYMIAFSIQTSALLAPDQDRDSWPNLDDLYPGHSDSAVSHPQEGCEHRSFCALGGGHHPWNLSGGLFSGKVAFSIDCDL